MTREVPRRAGFLEYYDELVGTWTRRLRNRQQAQDLAHDTFLRVLESRPEMSSSRVPICIRLRVISRSMVFAEKSYAMPRSRQPFPQVRPKRATRSSTCALSSWLSQLKGHCRNCR